jgi:glycosyltransferase involved in cell wall biosynthesis
MTGGWVSAMSPSKGAKAILIQGYEVLPGEENPALDAVWRLPLHKIVISRWLVELARDKFGDGDVSHVPNSVDIEQFHAPRRWRHSPPSVGFLYATSGFKECRTSMAAIETVRRRLADLRIVSFGAERPSRDLPLPKGVGFAYQPPQHAIRDLYAQCDVWLCGSRREGFHLPPLEAMACRCPVVSTRVGGPMDIIEEGVNGHLVDLGDTKALADRLIRVLTLPEDRWRAMSDAAYATATRYTWDDATTLFENALERAIAKSRPKRGEVSKVIDSRKARA